MENIIRKLLLSVHTRAPQVSTDPQRPFLHTDVVSTKIGFPPPSSPLPILFPSQNLPSPWTACVLRMVVRTRFTQHRHKHVYDGVFEHVIFARGYRSGIKVQSGNWLFNLTAAAAIHQKRRRGRRTCEIFLATATCPRQIN